MFLLVTEDTIALDGMAALLESREGVPRVWRAAGEGGAAALQPDFVAEDELDVQPIVNDDRVFVGQVRLDDRDGVLASLNVAPKDRPRMADSTIACMAWDLWGETALEKLAGDFAFAVWRRRERRMIAAVDHHGARRLLWCRSRRGLILSGQMAPLFAHPGVPREFDLDAIARLFDVGIARDSTPFKHVRALPGGHLLDWRGGEVHIRRWWNPGTSPSIVHRDPNDYVEETRELFERAVAARLRTKGSVSSTLSGGLDSGLVTATAARRLRGRGTHLVSYTAVPTPDLPRVERPGWDSDDTPYARETASLHDNVDQRFVSAGGRCVLDLLPDFHRRACTPTKSIANFLWLEPITTSVRQNGGRVLLLGEMGNGTISWPGVGAIGQVLALARRFLPRRFVQLPPPRSVSLLRAERHPSLRLRGGIYAERRGTRAHWAAFITTPLNVWWPDPAAQWGVEWRDPTADRRLIETLLRYPLHAFRTGGRERGLARALAAGLLPDRVRLRRTRGAQLPEGPSLIALHAKRYRAALEEMHRSPECRELLDFPAIQRALDVIAAGSLDGPLADAIDRAFDAGLFLCRR
jgi:asparagine synthase (glutamine-hydrolysing)